MAFEFFSLSIASYLFLTSSRSSPMLQKGSIVLAASIVADRARAVWRSPTRIVRGGYSLFWLLHYFILSRFLPLRPL